MSAAWSWRFLAFAAAEDVFVVADNEVQGGRSEDGARNKGHVGGSAEALFLVKVILGGGAGVARRGQLRKDPEESAGSERQRRQRS